jgi:hypothetical protein
MFTLTLPIIIGLVAGISVCLFIENPKTFIHSFILFGTIFSLLVFGYLAMKILHTSFIKKNILKFLGESLFIAIFTYMYCIIVYSFRGLPMNHFAFTGLTLLFVVIHLMLELSHTYI